MAGTIRTPIRLPRFIPNRLVAIPKAVQVIRMSRPTGPVKIIVMTIIRASTALLSSE